MIKNHFFEGKFCPSFSKTCNLLHSAFLMIIAVNLLGNHSFTGPEKIPKIRRFFMKSGDQGDLLKCSRNQEIFSLSSMFIIKRHRLLDS